jgi:hypothetical protein
MRLSVKTFNGCEDSRLPVFATRVRSVPDPFVFLHFAFAPFCDFGGPMKLAEASVEKCARNALKESGMRRFPPAEAGGKEETAEAV